MRLVFVKLTMLIFALNLIFFISFYKFEKSGWEKKVFDDDPTYYLTNGLYEVGLDWNSKDGRPNLLDLKKDQFFIDGVPFVSLERLIAWKKWKNKPKHLHDVELIEAYLAKNT